MLTITYISTLLGSSFCAFVPRRQTDETGFIQLHQFHRNDIIKFDGKPSAFTGTVTSFTDQLSSTGTVTSFTDPLASTGTVTSFTDPLATTTHTLPINTATSTETSTTTFIEELTVTEIKGDVEMAVQDPQEFLSNEATKDAFKCALADTVAVLCDTIDASFEVAGGSSYTKMQSGGGNIKVSYVITLQSIDWQNNAAPASIVSSLEAGDVGTALSTNFKSNLPPGSNFSLTVLELPPPLMTVEVMTRTKTTFTKTTTTTEAVSGIGDPHCKNLQGRRFDLYATGHLTFLRVPRSPSTENVQFQLDVDIARASTHVCSQTFITSVYITGKLLGKMKSIHVKQGLEGYLVTSVNGDQENQSLEGNQPNESIQIVNEKVYVKIPPVIVEVWQQRNPRYKVYYLSVVVKGLTDFHNDVGGLLGFDNPGDAAHPEPECVKMRQAARAAKAARAAHAANLPELASKDEEEGLMSHAAAEH